MGRGIILGYLCARHPTQKRRSGQLVLPHPRLVTRPLRAIAQQTQAKRNTTALQGQRNAQNAADPFALVQFPGEEQLHRRPKRLARGQSAALSDFLIRQAWVIEGYDVGGLVGPAAVDGHHTAVTIFGQPAALQSIGSRLVSVRPPIAGIFDPAIRRQSMPPQQP